MNHYMNFLGAIPGKVHLGGFASVLRFLPTTENPRFTRTDSHEMGPGIQIHKGRIHMKWVPHPTHPPHMDFRIFQMRTFSIESHPSCSLRPKGMQRVLYGERVCVLQRVLYSERVCTSTRVLYSEDVCFVLQSILARSLKKKKTGERVNLARAR